MLITSVRKNETVASPPGAREAQRGVVLVIALIFLVVMALATGALIRSVDVANLAAGNLSFKQAALSATDVGVEAAIARFRAGGALGPSVSLDNNITTEAYFATTQPTDARGIPTLLLDTTAYDTAFGNTFCFWANPSWSTTRKACTVAAAAADLGRVRYVIDRQCTSVGATNNAVCNYTGQPGATGGSTNSNPTGVSNAPLYRVTVRVDGFKNTVSYSQVVFRP